MISRRRIIASQQAAGAKSGAGRGQPVSGERGPGQQRRQQQRRLQLELCEAFERELELELARELAGELAGAGAGPRELQAAQHRHFDPYSVYGDEGDEEDDVWYSEERLFEDHIQEIADKWLAIDDEIWAKIICMERNRRIAKAYARKHTLLVNGSHDEYLDGTSLGLNSFENPDRDAKTRHVKQYIGQGVRIKITHKGDIVAKRLSKANVFLHKPALQLEPQSGSSSASSHGSSLLGAGGRHSPKLARSQPLELNKPLKIFDMANFRASLEREARSPAPDARRLQNQCFAVLGFVLDEPKMLNLPAWVMIINVVAIDLLKARLGLASERSLGGPRDLFAGYTAGGLSRAAPAAAGRSRPPPASSAHDYEGLDGQLAESRSPSPQAELADSQLLVQNQARRKPRASSAARQLAQEAAHVAAAAAGSQRAASQDRRRHLLQPKLVPSGSQVHVDGSASSGFNSNSSSSTRATADDLSAASSSSNIAPGPAGRVNALIQRHLARSLGALAPRAGSSPPSPPGAGRRGQPERCLHGSRSELAGSGSQLAPRQPRGQRALKLPPLGPADSDCELPEPAGSHPVPIPIPAPPTSARARPSGSANLILVAPTGLSPPRDQRRRLLAHQQAAPGGAPTAPSQRHLPAAIPAHAQLAPPETRRHIMRYLLGSAATERPLPGPPAASDESLYYCGLRARPAMVATSGPGAAGSPSSAAAAAAARPWQSAQLFSSSDNVSERAHRSLLGQVGLARLVARRRGAPVPPAPKLAPAALSRAPDAIAFG